MKLLCLYLFIFMVLNMWCKQKLSKLHNFFNTLWFFILLLFLLVPFNDALIVPKELPSVLSVIYSNIPPIKKGTDSRLGFGFRLGEHADFQIVVELGPQIETRPIGNQQQTSSFNKRQVNPIDQEIVMLEKEDKAIPSTIMTRKDNWLEQWNGDIHKLKSIGLTYPERELPKRPFVPEETLKQLQLLYKMATTTSTIATTKAESDIENDDLKDFDMNTMNTRIILPNSLEVLKTKFEKNDLQDFNENIIKK